MHNYAPHATQSDAVSTAQGADARPLVLHVVYRFDIGGLENGIVNLIEHMPKASYRHAVLALTEVSPDFRKRVRRDDVQFLALHKPPGQGFWLYPRLFRLFRQLRPAVVHSRNLAALETQLPAWAAGVPVRIHGEHGRDVGDLDGTNRGHQWMRRAYKPFVHHYLALSRDLAGYLETKVAVPRTLITQVYNGVDSERFHPSAGARAAIAGSPFNDPALWLVGTVGRMQAVKHQTLLAQAFVRALQMQPALRQRLRLVLVGDGPLRAEAAAILAAAGDDSLAWLPGERSDVPDVMRGLDCFVLPSLAEGISNTILEAMASGLPVIATDVGGNADLVVHGISGDIVPAGQVEPLAQSLVRMAVDGKRAMAMGQAGRRATEQRFSMQAMVSTYQNLYDREIALRAPQLRLR
jgi:sugar transferase (PEP-CTERM/EpsH1 system associated)